MLGGGNGSLTAWRFSSTGVPDRSFGGGDGTASAPGSEGRDVAVGPDDSVVVVGTNGNAGTAVKFDANGNGTSFGQRNIYRAEQSTTANTVLVEQNGTVLVAGQDKAGIRSQQVTQGYVTRFNPDGSTDTSFQGTTGSPGFYDAYGSFVAFFSLAFQDGKILVGGATDTSDSVVPTARFTRLLPSGALDPSFGNEGTSLLPASRGQARGDVGTRDLVVAGGDHPVGGGDFADGVVDEGGAWALERDLRAAEEHHSRRKQGELLPAHEAGGDRVEHQRGGHPERVLGADRDGEPRVHGPEPAQDEGIARRAVRAPEQLLLRRDHVGDGVGVAEEAGPGRDHEPPADEQPPGDERRQPARRPPHAGDSSSSVTGPSLTSSTSMCAPKTPPRAPSAVRTRS